MGKENHKITGDVKKEQMVDEIRKAARQFAMLYFHFCKTLYELLGMEKTKEIVRQTVFDLAVDRSEQLREKAQSQGKGTDTVEEFMDVIDLPLCGWIPQWGAPYYCDVIDTTTIENFTHSLSHQITQNVILEGESCERVYFESEDVKKGKYTYGSKQ